MIPERLREIGEVTHYYSSLGVAVVKLEDDIHQGDRIVIAGRKTDFGQYADSIELEHERIKEAHYGDSVGIKVADYVRPHDKVYLVA